MNALRQSNFKELCRACLKSINNKELNDTSDVARTNKNNLSNNKQLSKIFLYFTTLDVTKEMEDFPKLLCKLCMAKLMEYDAFRMLTMKSTETLFDMLKEKKETSAVFTENSSGEENVIQNKSLEDKYAKKIHVKKEASNSDSDMDNDDDKLLLPELSNMPLKIKPEPQCEVTDTQFMSPSFANGTVDGNLLYGGNITGHYVHYDDNAALSSTVYTSNKSVGIRKQHRMNDEQTFQCMECLRSFKSNASLSAHRKTYHQEEYFEFGDGANQMSTEMICSDADSNSKTELSCGMCGRSYSSKYSLGKHMKRHHQIKQHVCQECGVAKVTRAELVTHMRVHMPKKEKFSCPQCSQVFNHKNAISRHIKVVHEGERKFECSFCGKKFATRNSQKRHELIHTYPYDCTICHKRFTHEESLRSHMKNHRIKSLRMYVCSYCSQEFITLKNLEDHEKRHLGNKPHICNVCGKGFANAPDLKIHKQAHEE